jgi:hypothetical protein
LGGQVRLDRALLSATDQLELVVDGTDSARRALLIGGDWQGVVEVNGGVKVDRATVVRDTVSFQKAAPLALAKAIVIHRGGVRVEEPPTLPEKSWSDSAPEGQEFDVNVAVDLGRRVDLAMFLPMADDFGQFLAQASRIDVKAKVGGKLVVGVDAGETVVHGEVDVLAGTVRVLGQLMELQPDPDPVKQKIVFAGSDYYEPLLSLTAEREISGATAEVAISGQPSEPDVSLTSPDYADESQVMMMLLTDRRPEEVSAQGSAWAQNAVVAAATQALLGGGVGGLVNIDIDGTLTVGTAVGRSLFVEYEVRPTSLVENNSAVTVEATAPWEGMQGVVIHGTYGDKYSTAKLSFEKSFGQIKWWWDKSEDDEEDDEEE